MAETNSFDRLVSGLSAEERKDLLSKVHMIHTTEENESLAPLEKPAENTIAIAEQIKRKPLIFRLWLWLKSIIRNTPAEELFNEYKINTLARTIDRNFPGLIDYRRSLFKSGFYQKLSELKLCADFFRPCVSAAATDPDNFLVFLGSICMPDIEDKLDKDVDPYSNPLKAGVRLELRSKLLHKMDEIITGIPAQQKSDMYSAVRSVEWLTQFCTLPFATFLAFFSDLNDTAKVCSFGQVENEFNAFAKVLCNGLSIPEEVLEAIYLFKVRIEKKNKIQTIDENAEDAAPAYVEKAHSELSMMHTFIVNVPMLSIGRVIYQDSSWQSAEFTGGENWFRRYQETWKRLFDQKWEAWTTDCKKEALRQSLKSNFNLETFPLLPNRPWTDLWGGIPFRYELTGGFLNWYFKEKFPQFELTLKTILLEGDFISKEVRQNYSDMFNMMIQISIDLTNLNRKWESSGESGSIFTKLIDEHQRTLQGQTKAEGLIHAAESEIGSMIYHFGDACRTLTQVLDGILGLTVDIHAETLRNFTKIGGKENDAFQDKVRRAKTSLSEAHSLIKELEPIDMPSRSKN